MDGQKQYHFAHAYIQDNKTRSTCYMQWEAYEDQNSELLINTEAGLPMYASTRRQAVNVSKCVFSFGQLEQWKITAIPGSGNRLI